MPALGPRSVLLGITLVAVSVMIASLLRFLVRRTIFGALQLAGVGCLVVVLVTHVFERFHLFPQMGWGLPSSAGHYLDLSGAIGALIFIPTGVLLEVFSRHRRGSDMPDQKRSS